MSGAPHRLVQASLILFSIVLLILSPAATVTSASPAQTSSAETQGMTGILIHNTATPIQHVIIAIYENHAFDNYMSQFLGGTFGDPPGGVPQPNTQTNTTSYTIPYFTDWSYATNESSDVPDHDVAAIHGNIDNGSMDGYSYTDTATAAGMFPSYITPNFEGLAQQYGIGDSYFHAYQGPTLPNRFYYYADTSGPVLNNNGPPNGTEVYFNSMPALLRMNGLTWTSFDGNFNSDNGTGLCTPVKILFCDSPSFYFSTTLSQLTPMLYFNWIQNYQGQLANIQPYSNIMTDLADGTLPAVSWYTPDWLCCTEHPGTIDGFGGNITQGEQSLLQLVLALEASPEWDSTALFVSFDEGGGFYDHVPSPQIDPNGAGVRMPLLVISPYSKEGYVSHTFMTPESILHFIEYNWGLPSLQGGTTPGLDTEANLPLGFFNFNETPRAPIPGNIGGPNNLTSYPWPYTQPVAAGYIGTYEPELIASHQASWADQTANVILAPPVETTDGTILYEAGMDGLLRAVDPITGAALWTGNLGQASRSQPALLPDNGVVASTLRGDVTAYSSTGTLLWNISLGAPIYTGLTTVQGNYYGVLSNGSLFDVTENGSVVFDHQVTWSDVYAPPAYDPSTGLLLISTPSQGITATNLAGKVQWNDTIPGGVYAEGAVASGTLYVDGRQGGIYPISLPSGTVGAPASQGNISVTSPYISGSTLYAGNDTGYFAAYSLPSLTPLWNVQLWGGLSGSPQVLGNNVWVASDGGNIYELSTSNGVTLLNLHSGTSFYAGPLVTPTGVYLGGDDGNLLALNYGGELHLGVTPTSSTVTVGGAPVALTSGKTVLGLAAGKVNIVASDAGYVTQTVSVTVPLGGSVWQNITLVPSTVSPGTLAGTVTNASSGATLSSVTILVEPTGATVTSSAGGAYTLPLSVGTYSIFVNDSGYKPFLLNSVTISSGQTTTEPISLTPLHSGGGITPETLTGSVFNQSSGSPVAGVTVLIEPTGTSLTTLSTGAFTTNLDPGTYSIFVNATGYQPYDTSGVVITEGQTPNALTIELVPLTTSANVGAIAGTVTNQTNGAGVGTVSITLTLDGSGVSVATTTSGSDGSYTLSSLAPGAYAIYANASGYDPYFGFGIVVSAGHSTNQPIALTPVAHHAPPSGQGGSTPINWLLWGLVLAVVLAAVVLLAAVLIHNRRKKEELGPEMMVGEEGMVGAGAVAMAPDGSGAAPPDAVPMTSDGLPPPYDETAPAPEGAVPPGPAATWQE